MASFVISIFDWYMFPDFPLWETPPKRVKCGMHYSGGSSIVATNELLNECTVVEKDIGFAEMLENGLTDHSTQALDSK